MDEGHEPDLAIPKNLVDAQGHDRALVLSQLLATLRALAFRDVVLEVRARAGVRSALSTVRIMCADGFFDWYEQFVLFLYSGFILEFDEFVEDGAKRHMLVFRMVSSLGHIILDRFHNHFMDVSAFHCLVFIRE